MMTDLIRISSAGVILELHPVEYVLKPYMRMCKYSEAECSIHDRIKGASREGSYSQRD